MTIKVIRRYNCTSTAQAVDALARGYVLYNYVSGEGWQLCEPSSWSKRAIRRFVSRHRSDIQDWFEIQDVHFYAREEEYEEG